MWRRLECQYFYYLMIFLIFSFFILYLIDFKKSYYLSSYFCFWRICVCMYYSSDRKLWSSISYLLNFFTLSHLYLKFFFTLYYFTINILCVKIFIYTSRFIILCVRMHLRVSHLLIMSCYIMLLFMTYTII